ncbi:MAG: flagellar hook-associated protein FlgK [Burkholderiales bacterium]|nr:flagellar hook-associated protein FlgK [Burkholderiales bacterium]
MPNILSIGQTALNAAQAGLSTTSHNIANVNTAGYSRQSIEQASAGSQNTGSGFLGKGTSVSTVKRAYNEFLTNQVISSQTSQSSLSAYSAQIRQISNLFSDPTIGLSPSLQEFFAGVQAVAADPSSSGARQTMLSAAQTLAGQFQSVDARLGEVKQGVNSDITTSIESINSYAKQIAVLNDAIGKVVAGSDGKQPNDLLDQRDNLVEQLAKEIKVSVVKQDSDYQIFIGNGQPLVVSTGSYDLVPVSSVTDLGRIEVGYKGNNGVVTLPENAITGGRLGGLMEFRAESLDPTLNSLGRIAVGLTSTFNAQHVLGQDMNGALGTNFFSVGSPVVNTSSQNTGTGQMAATISNVNALTISDYQFQYVGVGNYRVTRLSDGAVTNSATLPMTVDGLDFSLTAGVLAAGDVFLIKPTAAGAAGFNVLINDPAKIAAAAPIRTAAPVTNAGSGKISAGSVDSTYTAATVTPAVTLTYNGTTNELTGFPVAMPVTVTNNGVATVFAAGAPVTYTSGATISFGGLSFTISGNPANADTFTIGPNTNGKGDNRNALLLSSIQTANSLGNSTLTLQGAFGQMVNLVGNKAHQVEINNNAEMALLEQARANQQEVSGVNLDEEASNMLRYQQAYQAAGKVMQTASKLFDLLLDLGG